MRIVLASGLRGLLLGVAGRAAMRLVALEAGVPVSSSTGGSLEVMAFGALVGAPVALVFFLVRARVRTRYPWPGLLTGLALFTILALAPPPAARSALGGTPDTPAATALAFAVVFAAWGLALECIGRRLHPLDEATARTVA